VASRPRRLTSLELEELELCERLRGREPIRDFLQRVVPWEPLLPHLEPLISRIEKARWAPRKFCVSYPPRHGKTETIKRAIAWWLNQSPTDVCAYVGKSSQFAEDQSESIRRYAVKGGAELGTLQRKGSWRTKQGGGLLASGSDKGLVGYGVSGLLVVDDPYPGREAAESPIQREHIWETFTSDTMTRLEGASVIVVHTRWVQDDLIGRLVTDHGWDYINIPALAEENDPLGRAPGEALWPDRYPASYFPQNVYSEYDFASLYQGRPRPKGASVFGTEHYYDQDTFSIDGCRLSLFADPAASTKTSADASAIVALAMKGRGSNTEAWVLDVYKKRVPVPQFARDLRAFQLRYGNPPTAVEAVGAFKAIPQMLEEIDPDLRITEVVPLGDKFTRSQPIATAWNAGRVYVPKPTDARPVPWLKDFLSEVTNFTGVGDRHDDQVDALSGAWNEGFEAEYGTVDLSGIQRRRI